MLNIVTALNIEAKPIIKKFKLKSIGSIFTNGNINLTVTGQGKIKSAINTALLLSKHRYPTLNIGIAGSSNHNIGDAFFIHKITDCDSGLEYYPDFFKSPSEELNTVSKTAKYFPLTDMEGSGFFEACYKFLTVDEIVLYKIVSDTPEIKPDKKLIPSLVEKNLLVIDILLETFSKKESFFNEIDELINEAKQKMKLTKTQENQLKQTLALYKIKSIPFPQFKKLNKKEEVKEFLNSLNIF